MKHHIPNRNTTKCYYYINAQSTSWCILLLHATKSNFVLEYLVCCSYSREIFILRYHFSIVFYIKLLLQHNLLPIYYNIVPIRYASFSLVNKMDLSWSLKTHIRYEKKLYTGINISLLFICLLLHRYFTTHTNT